MMALLDEYSRPSLAIQVEHQTTSPQVLPRPIRSDNGLEFVAAKVQQWLTDNQIKTIYIDPGSP